jgi:hypothetical protein
MIERIMGRLRFPTMIMSAKRRQGSTRVEAALDSRAGFGKRDRGRLLHKVVKNNGGSESDYTGDKAG